MVIAATDDSEVNIGVFDDAERRAMLVNVVDVPPLCNFILPAIVRTGPLAIAISTAGASPALAKRMKREIAELFGEPYARLAVILNDARGWAKAHPADLPGPQGVLRGDRQRRPRPGRAGPRGPRAGAAGADRGGEGAPLGGAGRLSRSGSGRRQGVEGDRREVDRGGGDHEQVEDLVVAEDGGVGVRALGRVDRPRRPCRAAPPAASSSAPATPIALSSAGKATTATQPSAR